MDAGGAIATQTWHRRWKFCAFLWSPAPFLFARRNVAVVRVEGVFYRGRNVRGFVQVVQVGGGVVGRGGITGKD